MTNYLYACLFATIAINVLPVEIAFLWGFVVWQQYLLLCLTRLLCFLPVIWLLVMHIRNRRSAKWQLVSAELLVVVVVIIIQGLYFSVVGVSLAQAAMNFF